METRDLLVLPGRSVRGRRPLGGHDPTSGAGTITQRILGLTRSQLYTRLKRFNLFDH
jgi:hypothetical protein